VVVVDASLVLGLVLPLPYSERAAARVRSLKEAGEELYAPALLEYEVCSALRRAVTRGFIDQETPLLALAEEMRCPVITADERLVRSACSLGASWVLAV
jgi:predicted nucleic acid-binding protein